MMDPPASVAPPSNFFIFIFTSFSLSFLPLLATDFFFIYFYNSLVLSLSHNNTNPYTFFYYFFYILWLQYPLHFYTSSQFLLFSIFTLENSQRIFCHHIAIFFSINNFIYLFFYFTNTTFYIFTIFISSWSLYLQAYLYFMIPLG